MPKKATFDCTHPTLRAPINVQKKQKTHVTLRERAFSSISNIMPLGTIAPPNSSNIDFIKNQEDTTPKYVSSLNKASRPTLRTSDNNSVDYSNNRNDFVRMLESTEDAFRTSKDTIDSLHFDDNFSSPNDNFSFSLLRQTSPAISSFNSDDEEERSFNSDEEEHFYKDNDFTKNADKSKNYYDINTELPGYTGDSGPYFPSLTAMWMFIWFTKNNIGNNYVQYSKRYLLFVFN
jgi:hypothetical protein